MQGRVASACFGAPAMTFGTVAYFIQGSGLAGAYIYRRGGRGGKWLLLDCFYVSGNGAGRGGSSRIGARGDLLSVDRDRGAVAFAQLAAERDELHLVAQLAQALDDVG